MAVGLMAASSCQLRDSFDLPSEDSISISLSGNIDQQNITRASDNGFTAGDQVGIWAVNYDGETPGTLVLKGNQATNVRFTFDGNSTGAVGENGGTTACDLNAGCGKGTSYIYMHAATGTGLYSLAPEVTDVVARQRWPWNGLVDITCKVAGTEWMAEGFDFVVAAVMADSSVRNVTHFWVVKDGRRSADRNVRADGDYRLLWDTGADLGAGVFSNVVVRVTVVRRAKVQLWKNGPYWATTNVGAEKPEDFGYYFWWGDTVGYRREGDAWVASDGSSSSFSFDSGGVKLPLCI